VRHPEQQAAVLLLLHVESDLDDRLVAGRLEQDLPLAGPVVALLEFDDTRGVPGRR
jgi:hypothetical protein